MNKYLFYDTCSLLLNAEHLFEEPHIIISSISIQELEDIKTSKSKDEKVKSTARHLLRELEAHQGDYELYLYKERMGEAITAKGFALSPDTKILACAIDYDKTQHPDETIFVTNDLILKRMANLYFGEDSILSIEPKAAEEYKGYKEFVAETDEQLAHIYEHSDENNFGLLVNQYLLIKDKEGSAIDILKWDGKSLVALDTRSIDTRWFGKIRPQDPQQRMAIDSLHSNQLTVIRGLPGSGKSLLGLGYLFSLLEKGKIDKIYIFANPIPVANAAKLGFYPGNKNDKVLDSQVGNFLVAKLGDMYCVQDMIDKGKLVLVPAVDVRGVSIPSSAGIYMTESQNTTKDLMKLLVQRIEEGTKAVIEGDAAQVDLDCYKGENNGLNALVNVCKGSDLFGTVTLNKIHRSRLADLAENIK